MKKPYFTPSFQIITLDSDLDIIATSEGIMMTSEGEEFNARRRSGNSMWDE